MKHIISAIIILSALAGCAKPVHVKIDESVASDLPREVALNFIQKAAKSPENWNSKWACIIETDGIRIPQGHDSRSGMFGLWKDLELTRFNSSTSGCNVYVSLPAFGRDEPCYIVSTTTTQSKIAYKNTGGIPDYPKMCRQTATALKSLGVKVN